MIKPIYKLCDWVSVNKLSYELLSKNPNAIDLLEQNLDKINWRYLSMNKNPNVIHLLEQNQDKISWTWLSTNPNIFEIDYEAMKQRLFDTGLAEKLVKKVFNPQRLFKICNDYNIEFDELIQIISK